MQYISHYKSPLGNILLAADETGLTGIWFEGQKYFPLSISTELKEAEIPEGKILLFERAKEWLDIYFSGRQPDFSLPLHVIGSVFQKEVWNTPLFHSLRPDHDLWRHCQTAGCQTGHTPYVCPGSGRRSRPQ